jgi:hypothetical protein
MNPIGILSDFMQAASFASAVVLLVLQIRALRRHSHLSFALLSVSTVCALFYFAIAEIMGFLAYKTLPTPVWLYPSGAAFLVLQIIFGMWGTISLFTSYRRLSETVPNRVIPILQSDDAPSIATLQVALPSKPPDRPVPTFLERLNDVLRLWLLRSSRNTSNLATEVWIVALAVLTLCLWIVLGRLHAGPNANFISWNIGGVLFWLVLRRGIRSMFYHPLRIRHRHNCRFR